MNKSLKIIFIVLMLLAVVSLAVSCKNKEAGISFDKDVYIIYLEENELFQPTVNVSGADGYTLLSSNPAVLEILDDGKTVKALKKDATATLTASSGGYTAQAEVIVYEAKDKVDQKPNEIYFVVRFDTLGKSAVPSQNVYPGEKAVLPDSPRHLDYVIAAWYTDKELTQEYVFSTPVTSNLTLYALWITADSPSFTFSEKQGGVYLSGLKYISIAYDNLILPSEDTSGRPVVGITDNAFYVKDGSNKQIQIKINTVTIPSSVKEIGKYAFYNCATLKAVYFDGESALQKIGEYSFYSCTSLITMALPDGVSEIGKFAYYNDAKYNPGAIPSALTSISESVFEKTALTHINLQNITTIGYRAFYGSKLAVITNPTGITKVETLAFDMTPWFTSEKTNSNNKGLVYLSDILVYYYTTSSNFDVELRQNTRLIANSAFKDTSNSIVRINAAVPPSLGSNAFSNTLAIVVPESEVSSYADLASGIYKTQIYYEATVLDSLKILVNPISANKTSVTNIIIRKYDAENSPAHLNIKEALYASYGEEILIKAIKTSAFRGLAALTKVILPPRISNIEINAFQNVSKFVWLEISGNFGTFTPSMTTLANSWFAGVSSNFNIYVPADKVAAYKSAWSNYASKITAIL